MNFSKETILEHAIELVRESGWEHLSARNLANRIGCSVMPIYSAVGSMEAVKQAVVDSCAEMAIRWGEQRYTDCPYLNQGVGFITFARDEANLFLVLTRYGASYGGLERYRAALRVRASEDIRFCRLDSKVVDTIFERLWVYTFGFAAAFIFGNATLIETRDIIDHIISAGSVIIFGALSGLNDYGGAEAEKIWKEMLEKTGTPMALVGPIEILV